MSGSFVPFAVLAGSGIYVGKHVADYLRERNEVLSRVISMPENESVSVVTFCGSPSINAVTWYSLNFLSTKVFKLKFSNATSPIHHFSLKHIEYLSDQYANTPCALIASAQKFEVDITTKPLTLPVYVHEGVQMGPLFYDEETKTVCDSVSDMAHNIASKKVPFGNVFTAAILGLVALTTIIAIRR